ncbi:MAG: DUF11 domain-containing protein, partial [Lachnospiraceae bacterium]|nr:DUF11 domain-containing protein [Lachnospiraceae bacterium]
MKLRKHLGRRVFALFLALLLSFNSLTVLAEDNPVNPETPAAESVEVTEPVDDTEVPTGTEAVDAESVEATEAEDTAESTEAKAEVKDGGVDESLNSEAAVNAEQPETEQPETEPAEEELPETKTETTDGETDSSEAEVQDREPAVNAQEDAPAVEEQKTADIADTDANVQKEADLPVEPVQDEISAGDGEVEAAPTEYATVDEFNAAVESMGDAEDEEAVYAVIARCQSIYERLSDADKDAMAEAYAAILSYAEDLGQSEIEALADKDCPVTVWGAFIGGSCTGGNSFSGPTYSSKYKYTIKVPYYSNNNFRIPPVSQFFSNYGNSFQYVSVASISSGQKQPGQNILIQSAGVSLVYYFKANHDYRTTSTPATCTNPGLITKKCLNCGDIQVTSTAALGHTYIGATWVDNNGSSSHYDGCTTTQHKQVCTRCGLAPQYADHTYGNWYTSGTLEKRDCTVCNHYETRPVTIPDVSLSYSGNGNTGGSAPASITVKKGSSVVVKNSGTLSKDNAEFLGWSTDPNAEEPELKYAPGSDVVLNASIILYAVWKDKVVLGVEKTVDKAEAKVGDILTYTIVVKNSGNKSVNNVVICKLPLKTVFTAKLFLTGFFIELFPHSRCRSDF